jgi:isoleucyl-tRNA synthetase
MEEYELTKAHRAIQTFAIYELSNWYIRRNRRRFWKGENDQDKLAAYQTLRYVLLNLLNISAPCAPYLSEDLYQRLKLDSDPESIHLSDLAKPDKSLIDKDLERKMEKAQIIVSLARSLREKSKIKVRQPLRRILVPVINSEDRRDIQYFSGIIKEELNIKDIEFVSSDTNIVQKTAKPEFKVIGKKFGKLTQKVAEFIKSMTDSQIVEFEKNHSLKTIIDNTSVELISEDIEIVSENIEGWLVASENNITVALDTQIDDLLRKEGIAREFVNRIQNLRKHYEFDVTDRIEISFNSGDEIAEALISLSDYISNETLSEKFERTKLDDGEKIEIDNEIIITKILKK